MDPITAFAVATLMMLMNGAVLGLVHRDLPPELQPSAANWRIGTLLIAAGCVLLALQSLLPPAIFLPLGNGLILLGMIGYWRALRLFYGLRDTLWLLLPLPVLMLGIWWFVAVQQSLPARVLFATATWVVVLGGCIVSLRAAPANDSAISRHVLLWLCGVLVLFLLLRMGFFLQPDIAIASVLDRGHWINLITPLLASVLPVVGTTAFLQLCSERIRRQWEHAASTDHLTGLANRRTLASQGEARLRGAMPGHGLALAVVDIDYFKSINDRFGHESGDLALKHVAERLASACGPDDLPARQGGEEFVVLLHAATPTEAAALGERLRAAVAESPLRLADTELRMTVSVGIALASPADRQLDDLLRRADQALYAAKSGGRNRVVMAAA